MALSKAEPQSRQRLVADAPQAKYKGVRFRADRKSWVAEMKPFKYKNKVSFGDFKSAMEAARAVDAAFFYYDKNKWRNFCDSPAFLSPLPGALTEEAKLKFVKEKARSMAFCALQLPSTWDPANRCDELPKTVAKRPTASRGNPAASISNDELVRSPQSSQSSLSLEAMLISPETAPDLGDDDGSQANVHPPIDSPILEMFPDISDEAPVRSEFDEPLDVNDYSLTPVDEVHTSLHL